MRSLGLSNNRACSMASRGLGEGVYPCKTGPMEGGRGSDPGRLCQRSLQECPDGYLCSIYRPPLQPILHTGQPSLPRRGAVIGSLLPIRPGLPSPVAAALLGCAPGPGPSTHTGRHARVCTQAVLVCLGSKRSAHAPCWSGQEKTPSRRWGRPEPTCRGLRGRGGGRGVPRSA